MPFGGFETLEEVVKAYQVTVREEHFVQPIPFSVDEGLRHRLDFFKRNAPVSVSEESICEFIIAPILQQLWMSYSDTLTLWSHVAFGTESPLLGFPDYFFARRSPLGLVREQPYVLFVEAKRDNFDKAWGQCLAAMLAAEQLNTSAHTRVMGSVSNGDVWYFARLEAKALQRDPRPFTVGNLDELFAALNSLFHQAKEQVQLAA